MKTHSILPAAVLTCAALGLAACSPSSPNNSATKTAHNTASTQSASASAARNTGFLFSPYKYTYALQNKPKDSISTRVNGTVQPLAKALPAGLNAVTLAFATGPCTDEKWEGFSSRKAAVRAIRALDKAGIYYIIATGGGGNDKVNGLFSCETPAQFLAFINRYRTPHMLGVDFDIEKSQTQAMIDQLVAATKVAAQHYPNMRFSFTVATFGSDQRATPNLGNLGARIIKSIRQHQLKHYLIDLMVMEYDQTLPQRCVIGANQRCDMGASAIAAAKNLHHLFGIAYSHMELTPMIGQNHASGTKQVFTLQDAKTMAAFVNKTGIAGVHFWALDRDRDCTQPLSHPKGTCNSYGKAGTFGFSHAFLKAFGGQAYTPPQ